MSFPCVARHYQDLLYGAYKSSDPADYLREFLEPYSDTLSTLQVRYLHKVLYNRQKMGKDAIIKYVEQEEKGISQGYPLSRFIIFAISVCHLWYSKPSAAYLYPLDPEESTIVCYHEANAPLPYVWLNVDVASGELQLVRCNVTHLQSLRVTSIWKWTDGHADRRPVRQGYTYDLHSGARYNDLGGGDTQGDALIVRVAVSGEDGRVGISCELGIEHEWPFAVILTYSSLDLHFILNKIVCNSRSGHLLPLLCALHPLEQT